MNSTLLAFVEVLALTGSRLSELARSLREDPSVESVEVAMAARRYASGDRIEWYVDAQLVSGNVLGWWLECRFEASTWILESSVRRNTESGEDELVALETRRAVDDQTLVAEIDVASAKLVAAGRNLDLTTF